MPNPINKNIKTNIILEILFILNIILTLINSRNPLRYPANNEKNALTGIITEINKI